MGGWVVKQHCLSVVESGLHRHVYFARWSLPETMRAATAVHSLAPPGAVGAKQRVLADQVLSACHGAFAANFVRYDLPIGAFSLLPQKLLSWCDQVVGSSQRCHCSPFPGCRLRWWNGISNPGR